LSDTQVNRKVAEAKAKLIESDIIYERLDLTLVKYKPQIDAVVHTPVTPVSTPTLPLAELWEKYTQHRSSKITKSTLVARQLDRPNDDDIDHPKNCSFQTGIPSCQRDQIEKQKQPRWQIAADC